MLYICWVKVLIGILREGITAQVGNVLMVALLPAGGWGLVGLHGLVAPPDGGHRTVFGGDQVDGQTRGDGLVWTKSHATDNVLPLIFNETEEVTLVRARQIAELSYGLQRSFGYAPNTAFPGVVANSRDRLGGFQLFISNVRTPPFTEIGSSFEA